MDIQRGKLEKLRSKRQLEKLERNLPDLLYDIEEYPATSINEENVILMHDMENNNQDSLIHVENACTENIKNEDELTQTDVNIVEEYNENFKKKGVLIESNLNKFQMRDDGSFYVYQEDISIRDEVQGHTNSDSDSSNHEHCHFDDVLEGLEMKCHSLEKSSPVPTSHGFKNPYSSNEKISDCTQCATVEDQNEPFSLNDKKIAVDKNINATNNTGKESAEMLRKLLEIKIKWKHFCENSLTLDENEIDKLFQSMGLSLETPTIKTEPQSKTVKNVEQEEEEEVKSVQEIFSMGLENKNQVGDSQPQTYSQVFTKYKNNKTMITGSQIPLHRVMSTLFDPKKLQVQHMDKWLNVDNNSKRLVWGMEGVMSIVSAFSMKNELFALKNGRGKKPDCGPYDGLADIIWQAGDGNSAIVVQYEPQFSYTRLFECLDAKICFNMNEVRSQLASVYTTPQPPISLILSVILTRGLDRIQKDLASSKIKTLLTPDGDETWSLILLLLIGQAVGHIMHTQFPKNWDPVRSPIGILSLDEYGEKVYVS